MHGSKGTMLSLVLIIECNQRISLGQANIVKRLVCCQRAEDAATLPKFLDTLYYLKF